MVPLRALIVDDEDSVLVICSTVLKRLGIETETAATAAEGRAKARAIPFDLALIDWLLPDGSGVTLFEELRRYAPQLIGILITGQNAPETVREAFEVGFWAFLPKPFTLTELRGIVERAAAHIQAIRERERLSLMVSLSEVAMKFMGSLRLDEVVRAILRVAYEQTGTDRVSLMLVGPSDPPHLQLIGAFGLPEEFLKAHIPVGEGIAGRVVETGEPILLNTQTVHLLSGLPLRYQGRGSALCLPLKTGDRIIGVLNLTKLGDDRPFTESDIRLYFFLATQAAIAIENARLHQRVWEGHLASLRSFARYAENREPYREGHAERVGTYAQKLAEAVGFSPAEAEQLLIAGLIHDLGLLHVPEKILRKPSPLNEEEWALVRSHPQESLNLMERQAFLSEAAVKAVRYHHERYDGRGYPEGLKGDAIPIEGRLLSVADTFDALTHDRPYRPAYPLKEAVAEMQRVSGTQLDPDLTDLFLREVVPDLSH